MINNRKRERKSLESKVKKITTTFMRYLCKCIIKIVIEKIIDTLIN